MAGSRTLRSNRSRGRGDSSSRGGRSSDGGESTTSSRGRRVIIKPLSTIGDRGKPSKSVAKDLQRVVNLIQDERHLVAYDLYLDCKERMKDLRDKKKQLDDENAARDAKSKTKRTWLPQKKKSPNSTVFDTEEFDAAIDLVRKHKEAFTVLEKRALLFQACRDNMDESEGWTLAQTMFGVTTFYRREGDGSLSIKLEGELKGSPLFEQVCVLREIDLHSHWAPFVTSSLTVAYFDKLDTIGWFMLGLPNFGIARDACFRAIGCDCVEEDQSVVIVGRGVEDRQPGHTADEGSRFLSDDPEIKTLDIPPIPTRLGSGRMTMKRFECKIRVMAPDHCHTYILANINPNLAFIPQALLEFVMKKMIGFLLIKLMSAAKKILKDPVRNVHAQRMRQESAFYRDWLVPKFRNVAAEQGWEMPGIAAFDLTEAQQVEAEKLVERTGGAQMHSFCQFDTGDGEDGLESTRSTPNLYHSKPLDKKDDDSDISSLSGTSQSIWKNNPIASYLRDIEVKTQQRKDKAVLNARRKAAARLQPKPLPVDRKERLQELKNHKRRKQASRQFSSAGSTDGFSLSPVDEHDANTVATGATGRSVPYSPISAALDGQGRWRRLWVVSGMVLSLFLFLQLDRFLPSFLDVGGPKLTGFLRDSVALLYMAMCGVLHFFLCDVQLIYAFEAFELGMKSGEQVKTFYRGQVRLLVAAGSGVMVVMSITKAVLLAWLKAAIVWLFAQYKHWVAIYFYTSTDHISSSENVTEDSASVETSDMDTTASANSSVIALLFDVYALIMGFIHAVFNWQLKVFVRSNMIGRTLESLTTGAYNAWTGILSSFGNSIYAAMTNEHEHCGPGYSWRDDAISTLRVLLTYTAVLLLVILVFLNIYSKGYRHMPGIESSDKPSVATASTASEGELNLSSPNSNGRFPKRVVAPSKSMDSNTARRRMRNVRGKRREKIDEDSE